MIPLGVIGPSQLLLILFVLIFPVGLFFIGYYFGKKSGYLKRIKEEELKK